ncbi:MAG TPA: cation-transporting P-type ATPase, partial [Candidatus Omnitrophota bacterium]|nr:cation-transporting P-type ATPase [Candidatus Omnitrophota bacterium]
MANEFDIKDVRGLDPGQAAERLKKDGYNELPAQKSRNFVQILIGVLREPMLMLLLFSGCIYLVLGEARDALMLLLFVAVVVGITFVQERRTERALDALKNLSSPRALVIRGGRQVRIPGREVVMEDVMILREGDRVPADAVILFSANLMVNESLLTGESLAVRKTEWDGKETIKQPGGEDIPFVYSGTLVVQGHGVARVTRTGPDTEMGKIGKAIGSIEEEDTQLKKETAKLVRDFTIGGLVLCLVVILIYGITRGGWLNGFLAGLSLSMAMLPEEFSVVLLIFLSLGAWRMSRRKVLTHKMQAIETLGSATVLCVDKTGTITENRMVLSELWAGDEHIQVEGKNDGLPEKFHDLLEFANLASQKDPFDPVEKEIKETTEKFLAGSEHIHHNWKLVREYPLSKHLLALSHVWGSPDKMNYVIAAKGAPEAIFDLCHLSETEKAEQLKLVHKMSDNGLRILGAAKAQFQKGSLPGEQHDFNFQFVGLLGFIDPVRPSVKESLQECYEAGMRVIMITGDYPGTAQHVARQIGLKNPDKFITGPELKNMDFNLLRERLFETNIFARVVPEQKLELVSALKANG